MVVDVGVHVFQIIALELNFGLVLEEGEDEEGNFVGSHGALHPGGVAGEVILELHRLFEQRLVVVLFDGLQDNNKFALEFAFPVDEVSH